MKLSYRSTPMSQLTLLCLTLLCSILLAPPPLPVAADDETLSAYDVLHSYNFPIGLLPQGVTSYELDEETGKFAAYLDGSCSFKIQGYPLKYKSKITGVISKGKLSNLKGVSVKLLLLWVNIVKVTRTENNLEFSVGIASADFSLDGFDESPQCGCGFDCVNQQPAGDGFEIGKGGQSQDAERLFSWNLNV